MQFDSIPERSPACDSPRSLPVANRKQSKAVKLIPMVNVFPQKCHFWMPRKKRFCGLPNLDGNTLCTEHHFPLNSTPRIPCPMDPNHSILETRLAKHLLVCNSKPKPKYPHFKHEANIFSPHATYDHKFAREELRNLASSEFLALIEKIRSLFREHVGDLCLEMLDHVSVDTTTRIKHRTQQASLLGNLNRLSLLKPGNTYLELGAGKADLSLQIQMAVTNAYFILIDRRNFRYKCDRAINTNMSNNDLGAGIERWTMDLRDVDLHGSELIGKRAIQGHGLVAVSKHLCGCATDFSLRAISNFLCTGGKVEGIAIALCCHHQCQFENYAGREFWESLGLTDRDFALCIVLSTWALCGRREQDTDDDDGDEEHGILDKEDTNESHWSGMTFEEREILGAQCKRVIDIGRVKFIEKLGFEAGLVHYVGKDITPENCLLWAKLK